MSTSDELFIPAYEPVTPLRAGPISLLFSNGDLRQLRVGNVEIVQRIYVAVRDHNWGTAPVQLDDVVIDDYGDHFRVSFTATHRQNDVGFTWQGSIIGDTDGSIRFSMDGRATSTFRRNRIGFCVLHPASAAGAPAQLTHSDGSKSASAFPKYISPHQPFMDLAAITHEYAPGQLVETSFEGDIFESEDQRNWTDASYKTYSTPLSIPYPVTIEAGTEISQTVSVRLLGRLPQMPASGSSSPTTTVTIGSAPTGQLPAIGLGIASHGQRLSSGETSRLAALNLSHVRVDLDLSQDDIAEKLSQAASQANALGAGLEIALFVGEDHEHELSQFQRAFASAQPKVARWLLFARYANTTPTELARAARPMLKRLAPEAPVGGGTNLYFVHLNRERPPVDELDFVTFSINPQVHAFDPVSLVENMIVQPAAIESALAFCKDRPISISPITLRPRFNPDASGPELPPKPGELPAAVDVRQPTGFAAAWTLGSLNNLAQSGVQSVTCFETTGWRGLMETEQGSPLPEKFASYPSMLFPLYYLFEALGPFAGGAIFPTMPSDALLVSAMSVSRGTDRCTIIGNLLNTPQRIQVDGVNAPVSVETLGDRAGSIQYNHDQQPMWVELAPFALVCLRDRVAV